MGEPHLLEGSGGEKSWVVLQTLLCMLREKNLLTRADIEELCDRLERRAKDHDSDPLPCCGEGASAAANEMHTLSSYIGARYGGKHRRAY